MIEITLTPEEFQKLQERLTNLRPALGRIGDTLVHYARKAFLDQSLGSEPWSPPYGGSPFNYAGIINDLQTSSSVHDYNLMRRPALRASGRLFESMNAENLHFGNDTVELTTPISYAGQQQDGGVTTQQITQAIRNNLTAFLREHPQYRRTLRFIFGQDTHITNIQARPFFGFIPAELDEITTIVENYIAYGE